MAIASKDSWWKCHTWQTVADWVNTCLHLPVTVRLFVRPWVTPESRSDPPSLPCFSEPLLFIFVVVPRVSVLSVGPNPAWQDTRVVRNTIHSKYYPQGRDLPSLCNALCWRIDSLSKLHTSWLWVSPYLAVHDWNTRCSCLGDVWFTIFFESLRNICTFCFFGNVWFLTL